MDGEPLGREGGSAFVPFYLGGKLWFGPVQVCRPSARCLQYSAVAAGFGCVCVCTRGLRMPPVGGIWLLDMFGLALPVFSTS